MLKSAEASQVNDVRDLLRLPITFIPKCDSLQTISNVMKPGAAKAVQSWMQDADEKGKNNQCLFQVFQFQHLQNETWQSVSLVPLAADP